MKNEKGVTLVSVIIYVIAMVIAVALITVMTNYFYKNVEYVDDDVKLDKQYTTVTMFFAEEVNIENNKILEINESINDKGQKQKWVAFASKNQYTFVEANKSLYRNNIKIADDIEMFEITNENLERKTRI